MPPTPNEAGKREIRLRETALTVLADAARDAGEYLPAGRRGRPSIPAALGISRQARTGTESYLFAADPARRNLPSNQSLARMSQRLADLRGISWWEALGELCENVPLDEDAQKAAA